MSYRKDQGRYARMFAFWAIVLLVAYGCLHGGGLSDQVDRWMGDANSTLVDPFPILGTLKTSSLIALGVLAVAALVVYRILNKPRIADTLIETEAELHKVTWPTWKEVWITTAMVLVMVALTSVFFLLTDLVIGSAVQFVLQLGQ